MPAAALGMAGGYPEMQQFNIPTTVGGAPPMQAPPRPQLQFPVFTPPSASSYGTPTPAPVPWTPPDLAGAINAGIKTGGELATSFLTNRKTAMDIQGEEQARKVAIARAADPNAAFYTSAEVGPGGTTVKYMSPAEYQVMKLGMAKTQAEIEASRAATGKSAAEVAALKEKTPAEVRRTQAEARKAEVESGANGFYQATGTGAAASGSSAENFNIRTGTAAQGKDWSTAYGGTNIE